jgi:hypothetical protein
MHNLQKTNDHFIYWKSSIYFKVKEKLIKKINNITK